jgi:hypothetical protein
MILLLSIASDLTSSKALAFDIWIADPTVIKQDLLRKQVSAESSRYMTRSVTKNGEVFRVNPSGFWSKESYRAYVPPDDPSFGQIPDVSATFILPDGSVAFGGEEHLNFVEYGPRAATRIVAGGIWKAGKTRRFRDACFITAFSNNLKFVGLVDDDKVHPTLPGGLGEPCRIINGRAYRLPVPGWLNASTVRPIAVNNRGYVIASAPDPLFFSKASRVGTNDGQSIVWNNKNRYFSTRKRFNLKGKSVKFNCFLGSNGFAGAVYDQSRTCHAITSNGRKIFYLEEPKGLAYSYVSKEIPEGCAGGFGLRSKTWPFGYGCIWIRGKFFALQDLVKSDDDWVIGPVEAVGERGELAVNVFSRSSWEKDRKIICRVALLTPRRGQ